MLPRIILHNGISVDGRYDWYTGDVGLYYELAGRLEGAAMLSGSNTVLAAFAAAEGVIPLRLVHLEQLRDDAVWLRYEVMK